jgi:hypothetical protein
MNLQLFSTTKNLLAGGLAGAFEASVMYPSEYIKTQLQLASRKSTTSGALQYKGVVDCATQIVKQRGFFALYKGQFKQAKQLKIIDIDCEQI